MWIGTEQQFGIDLGTSNTLIFQKGKGIVLQEPSVIAIQTNSGKIEAVGEEAKAMIGRTSDQLEVIYPLKEGMIANFDLVTTMMQLFFQKVLKRRLWLQQSNIVISVPCHITDVARRAVENIIVHKGAKKAAVIKEPIAAAYGAGLPLDEPVGRMVLDIGGGSSQIAVLSLGGIVASYSNQRGGIFIDHIIAEYIKKTYKLVIGESTAEKIKMDLGYAELPEDKEKSLEVRGRDLVQGLPKTILITAHEISLLLNDFITEMIQSIRQVIEQCPPELVGDVMDGGIMLCGGGSLLKGLDRRLQNETHIPVHRADRPLECIALGTEKLLNDQKESILKTK